MESLENIKGWLFNAGENELSFSFQDNRKYRAQVVNAIDFTQIYGLASTFPLLFSCRPFSYAVNNSEVTITSSGTTIENPGTIVSKPIISVFGSGNITLNINDQELQLEDIPDPIIINCDLQDCYDNSLSNLNNKMTGEFPVLDPGDNLLSWSGSVTKLEILPNWRWL
jgi:phage-related protein